MVHDNVQYQRFMLEITRPKTEIADQIYISTTMNMDFKNSAIVCIIVFGIKHPRVHLGKKCTA